MKENAILTLVLIAMILGLGSITATAKDLTYSPVEVESMLYLFNRHPIKGTDVEFMAPLQVKLKNGLQEARALADSSATVSLDLTLREIQTCIEILDEAQIEAKYTQLIYGMKQKLKTLLPDPTTSGMTPIQ